MEKRQISLSRSESSVGVMEVNNKSFLLFSLKEAIKKKLNFSFSQLNWFGVAWWLCKVHNWCYLLPGAKLYWLLDE